MAKELLNLFNMSPVDGYRILICPPHHFQVSYVINPWMEGNIGRVAAEHARDQWTRLHEVLLEHFTVEEVQPGIDLPDMVFTANAGLVCRDKFFPCRFTFPERRPERQLFINWFRNAGFQVVEMPGEGPFEGEGDALFQPGEPLLWAGYGVRSSLGSYLGLEHLIEAEILPLRLVDPRFYHLDTCFCPLPDGRVLYFPPAFDRDSQKLIASRIASDRRVEVEASEALHFVCNALVTHDTFIANQISPHTARRLRHWGFNPIVSPVEQFLLAGGGVKCLAIHLKHQFPGGACPLSPLCQRQIESRGHLLDSGLLNQIFDRIEESGCSFQTLQFDTAARRDEESYARLRIIAPSSSRLNEAISHLLQLGARTIEEETDARLETVEIDGVAPAEFYSTTIYPTDVRAAGSWIRVLRQRMDAVIVVDGQDGALSARCVLLRDLRRGDRVVCGVTGVRVHTWTAVKRDETFQFMSASISSERRVDVAIDQLAWEMVRIRERGGKTVVVAGPVVVHTGGGRHLAWLIEHGFVQALLGGNAIAVHDIEQALYGTSLGIDLERGVSVEGGHRRHLMAINTIRGCGGIARAVEQGILRSGIMHALVKHGVPFSLAGSIRDDGPLPEVRMDLIEAQREYAELLEGAEMVLMLSSMLHSIGVGNMTPAGVRLVCVDINQSVLTKLADRGSMESVGIVTEVGLFLNRLTTRLAELTHVESLSDAGGH